MSSGAVGGASSSKVIAAGSGQLTCLKVDSIIGGVCSALEAAARQSEKYSASVSGLNKQVGHFPNLLPIAERILVNGLCSKESFIIAHIYGQRLVKKKTTYILNSRSLVPFFLASLIVASKFLDDFYCRNAYFASVGDMSLDELNALELRLCFLLDFDLNVSKEEFDKMYLSLTIESCFISPTAWKVPKSVSISESIDSCHRSSSGAWTATNVSTSKSIDSCYRGSSSGAWTSTSVPPSKSIGSSYGVPLSAGPSNIPLDTTGWPALPSATLSTVRYSDVALPWDPAAIWQPDASRQAPGPPCRDPLGAAAAWFSSRPQCPPA